MREQVLSLSGDCLSAVPDAGGIDLDVGVIFVRRARVWRLRLKRSVVKLLRLTPEPKALSIGIAAPKRRLSPAAEKFWQCAKQVAAEK